ncbi:MAG: outer membrane beta-barrel protein [Thermotogota bacterium]
MFFIIFPLSIVKGQQNNYIDINISPQLSGITGVRNFPNIERGKPQLGFQAGFNFGVQLSNNFFTEFGISYQNVKQNFVYFEEQDRIRKIQLKYLTLPVLLKYNLLNKKYSLSPVLGISLDYRVYVSDNINEVSPLQCLYNPDKMYTKFHSSVLTGIEIRRQIFENISLKCDYTFSYGLTKLMEWDALVNLKNQNLFSHGLNIGIEYRLN